MRALVIENEAKIARGVSSCLSRLGLSIDTTDNGHDGLWRASEGSYALITLGIDLPQMSGGEVCRTLRARGVQAPILVFSDSIEESAEIEAIERGADGFIRIPFSGALLAARSQALLRRGQDRSKPLRHAGVEYDPASRRCLVDGRSIRLTPRESQVLSTLIHAGDRPVSRRELLHSVWGLDFDGEGNVVDVYIRYLRQKIGNDRILTIARIGYVLVEPTPT